MDERYVYVDSLGSGGMAQVILARDTILDRHVAIKILRDHYAENPEFVERFRSEAQSAAALSHPNIVSVYDLGRSADGTYYIAMEHVEGGTLKERLDREVRFPEVEAAAFGAQIADALHAAHQNGVIHRDIKPQNVLLTETGESRVADFGIARASSAATDTRTDLVLGTASYMSPEQASGEALGPQSDLYSLGVVLYEMLTGRLPFEAGSPTALAFKQVYEEPNPPVEAEPSVTEGMNALVMKLLSKNPADRYESAAEVSEELGRIRDGGEPIVPIAPASGDSVTAPLPTAGGVPRRKQRFPLALLGAVAALGVVALAILFGINEVRQPAGEVGVPRLIGMEIPEARQTLEEDELELGTVSREAGADTPEGEILSQSPESGATAQNGDAVDVTVSSGGDPPGGGDSGNPGGADNQYSGAGN